jgi:hypothetical protein
MTDRALKKFTAIAEQAQVQCDKFAKSFAEDPAYALSWGTSAFQSATRLRVAKMLVDTFTPREGEIMCTLEQAREYLTDRVMNKARYPAQSTSPTSNLIEQYEAAAYAEALDELKYM